MTNKDTDQELEGISELIRHEEEDALAFFRTRNFRDRVEARLKDTAGDRKPAYLFQRRAVPFLAAALALIVAGAYLFVLKGPASGPSPEFSDLAAGLSQLPGLSHPPGKGWTALPGQTGTSQLAESVRLVLVSAEKTKREEEQEISIPAGTGKVPRLSLDQKMEILFKERAIERALLLFKGGSKEV
jgi:hypothetical protein